MRFTLLLTLFSLLTTFSFSQTTTLYLTTSGGSWQSEKWVEITTGPNNTGTVIWAQGDGTYGNGGGLVTDASFIIDDGTTYYINCHDRYADGWDGTTYEIRTAPGGGGVLIANNGGDSPDDGTDDDSSSSWETRALEREVSEAFSYTPPNNPPNCDATLTSPTTDFPIDGTLTWSDATGFPTGYDVTVGTSSGGNDIIDVDNGASTSLDLSGAGLSYSTTYYVNIVPYNGNGSATGCTEETFVTESDPTITVDCGTGENVTHCYDNFDATTWLFESGDGTSPLEIVFNAGGIENCCDDIIIYDGSDNTAPELYRGSNGGDLTGLTVAGTGTTLFMEIDSDGSVSCVSGGTCCTTSWDFDVNCKSCVVPSATYTVVDDCQNSGGFKIDVNITDLGSATSLTVADDQSNSITGVNSTGVVTLPTSGGYTNGTDVVITVTNEQDGTCEIMSGTLTQATCPPANDECANATPFTIQSSGSCPGSTTFSTTGASEDADELTSCDASGNLGVWYSFTAPSSGNLEFESITGSPGIVIYEGTCGSLTEVAGTCFNNASGSITGLTSGNSYYAMIWTDVAESTVEFCLYELNCTPPTFTLADGGNNCPTEEFFIDVDVTDIGSGSSVDISDGTTTYETGVGIGTYNIGPFAAGTSVDVTVADNADATCNDLQSYTTPGTCPPANDDLCNAEAIVINDPEITGTTVGATAETDEPDGSCWFGTTSMESVWYSFTPATTEEITVSTDYPNTDLHDTHIAVYEVSDCSDMTTLMEVACSEDDGDAAPSGWTSITSFTPMAGTTYYVQVDGYGSADGEFNLRVYNGCLASNDIALINTTTTLLPANTCDNPDNEYTYYGDGSSGEYYFAIDWGTNNQAAKDAAEVTITVDDLGTAEDAGVPEATYTMSRYWNVDLNGTSLNEDVTVRFYYDATEKTEVDDLANTFATDNSVPEETAMWFKTVGQDFNPANITATAPGQGAIELTPTESMENGENYAEFVISSFSGGTYATGAGSQGDVLPIKLLSFKAFESGKTNTIQWTTASELNTKTMTIEASPDGNKWREVKAVDSKGSEFSGQEYTSLDPQPYAVTYYRISSEDLDGSIQKSHVISVRRISSKDYWSAKVAPNPTNGQSILSLDTYQEDFVTISVTDMTGKLVKSSKQNITKGMNTVELDINNQASGVYLIHIKGEFNSEVLKLYKQ